MPQTSYRCSILPAKLRHRTINESSVIKPKDLPPLDMTKMRRTIPSETVAQHLQHAGIILLVERFCVQPPICFKLNNNKNCYRTTIKLIFVEKL